MSATNSLVKTLLAMTGQANVITIPRAFIDFTGTLESAMMLNQLLYWMPRSHLDGNALYKTDADWVEELRLTRYAVRQARDVLVKMGFLTTSVHHKQGTPAVHYHIDYEMLTEKWEAWLQDNGVKCETERYKPPSKVRNRTLPDESSSKTNAVKFENERSKVRKRTMHGTEITTEITPEIPTPTPTLRQSENHVVVGVGDHARESLFIELRRRKISRVKAIDICATDADDADILTSIDNLYDPNDPATMGGVINLLIDAPPPKGQPYERQSRSVQSDVSAHQPKRATGRHNGTGGAELKDPGWQQREIARIQREYGISEGDV